MKTVLIITVQKAPNYGACLQAYALWKYISDLGYNCKIIDLYRPYHKGFIYTKGFDPMVKHERSLFMNIRIKYIRPFRSKFKDILKTVKYKKNNNQQKEKTEQSITLFESFNMKMSYTIPYRSIKELYDNPPEADVYITGSDQLWNPTQPYALEPFFLTFVKNNGKRVSYATSIGVPSLSKYTQKKFTLWLKEYEIISVREKKAIELLKQLTDKPIYNSCDPTLLLSKNHWESLSANVMEEEKYIFLFSLGFDKELYDYAAKMKKKLGFKVIVNYNKNIDISRYGFVLMKDSGPIEWISYINNAECVITNSFHGSVFSLLMHTPFRVKISNNRGSRILNLLNKVDAEHLLMKNQEKEYKIPLIDFNKIDNLIIKMKKESELILYKILQ